MTIARTHPPSVRTIVTRFFQESFPAGVRDARILVAVSGGPDSTALVHALAGLRSTLQFTLGAHGVDHGLRKGAAAELDRAAAASERCGVPFARTEVRVSAGGNLQARARDARYDALEGAARAGAFDFIATAHHADDRAETVLLRLLRGSGTRGLAVLPPVSGNRIRPLLRARRVALRAYVDERELPYAVDPSNAEARFLRVRVRNELLPLLVTLDPGIVGHLNAIADELAVSHGSVANEGEFPTASPQFLRLPRATELALAALLHGKGSKKAEVLLPGGLVVTARGTNRKRT